MNYGANFYALIPQSLNDKSVALLLGEGDREIYGHSASIKGNYPGGPRLGHPGTNEVAHQKGADILTLLDEYYYNVATGEADLDASWNDFQASLVRFGVEEIKAAYQAEYDMSN